MFRVRTEIFDNYWIATTEVDIDDFLFKKALRPIDRPKPYATPFERNLCTDAATIKMVMNDREKLAKEIAETVTIQLLNFMSQQDTVMGYKVIKMSDP